MSADPVRLVTLAPGHFHAALVQKQALRGVDPHVHVYGPLDGDLIAHLDRIARFSARPDQPTAWTVDVHAGPDWLDRFLAERPGNAVVIAGRNRPKIDLILAAVSAGYCVLADKPWVVEAADLPKLEQVFVEAARNGVFAWDVMTERFEETTHLQRELIRDPDVFGEPIPGTPDEPALELESVHFLSKQVAGVPLRRPAWWFEPAVAGEAMADVGTHLADLALWLLFPFEGIDYRTDVEVLAATRWPTRVGIDDFRQITGLPHVPAELAHLRDGDGLTYWGNGSATVRIRDRVVRLTTRWGVKADGPDGDTHFARARGSRSTVTVRHDPAMGPGPQVFVTPVPNSPAEVLAACRTHRQSVDLADRIHLPVTAAERTGHESHFAEVLAEFIGHFKNRAGIPAWERPNLLAKYHITTRAVELARS
jgi:predicted dehydrogenase